VTVYLDTSVVLRVLLGQKGAWEGWARWRSAYASDLLGLEARRAIDRLRLESALDDEGVAEAQEGLQRIQASIGRIPLTRAILARAGLPMATVVRSLDAVHLASALRLSERRRRPVLFVTHDERQALGARALGLGCAGV
jgi:predicted nucleic acid-binding protein